MNEKLPHLLSQLRFTTKEAEVYLLLLELGTHPAATLAKKIALPKSTILFICNNLVERGYIKKTFRGRTQFFHADPEYLHTAMKKQLGHEQAALQRLIPLLHEIKNPYSAEPKVTFYEGVDGCRTAYLQLLHSKTEILEFGIHKDLVEKLGEEFMESFIKERVKRKIFLRAIANDNDIERALLLRDKKELRSQHHFSPEFGTTYSSLAIYESKVLMLNLHTDAFGILIENREVSETLRTIFNLLWHHTSKKRLLT